MTTKKVDETASNIALAMTQRFNQNRGVHKKAVEGLTEEQTVDFDQRLLGALMTLTNPIEFKETIDRLKKDMSNGIR